MGAVGLVVEDIDNSKLVVVLVQCKDKVALQTRLIKCLAWSLTSLNWLRDWWWWPDT